MPSVKISHVVSFSSQNPKYPAENLLDPYKHWGPWLSCPQDKSGQQKVELQLERAVPISYIDVGNYGCAFLQIDVGRSSWPLDRPFLTLLPATMLMSITDSKKGKKRLGIRMFKRDHFLTEASGESWDRLRLICSQPFARHQSFGLSFLRVYSSVDSSADPVVDPSAPGNPELTQDSSNTQESGPSPCTANPSIRRTAFPDLQTRAKMILIRRGLLRRYQTRVLGRSAYMALSAIGRASPASAARPTDSHSEPSASLPKTPESRAKKQNGKSDSDGMKRRKVESPRLQSNSSSRPNRETARARQREHGAQTQNGVQTSAQCPICTDSFSIDMLPLHAATCGETSPPRPASPSSSSSSSSSVQCVSSPESSPPVSRVQCPICELQFSAREIEKHASVCGEVFTA